MTDLPALIPLERNEFMSRLGHTEEVHPAITQAWKFIQERDAKKSDQGHGRDDKWHVSFHGSQFPGDDPMACSRQHLYRLLDLGRSPMDRRGKHFTDAGKDYETQVCSMLYQAGMLVSEPPWRHQTQFENSDAWLTCTTDALILPLRAKRPFVGEFKLVFNRHLENFKNLVAGPNEQYVRQTKCEVNMAHDYGPIKVIRCYNSGRLGIDSKLLENGTVVNFKKVCPEHGTDACLQEETLDPVEHGWLSYASRDDPFFHREFHFGLDPEFMDQGIKKLEEWKQLFIEDKLPQTVFSDKRYAHPFGWRWSYAPCQWCNYSAVCKEDTKLANKTGKPIKLSGSDGIVDAKLANLEYSYEEVRNAVFNRWGLPTPIASNASLFA